MPAWRCPTCQDERKQRVENHEASEKCAKCGADRPASAGPPKPMVPAPPPKIPFDPNADAKLTPNEDK